MAGEEFQGDTWALTGARTKNRKPHTVPLPPPARAIIDEYRRPGFLFTTNGGRSAVSGFSRAKERLDSLMEEVLGRPIAPWRIHDLRRTVATGMAEMGIAPHIVEAVLNHISGARAGVAGIYNRAAYVPERRVALEWWAARIERIVTGKAAKVIALRGA